MVVLAHLQGVAATFRVGRHHHRGPLCEGRGLTHALTDTVPTDLTVASALVRKACSKRRRSRLWSKPVNLRTWGLVSDPIVTVQAFAELRYGVVVHMREHSVKYGHTINQTLYRVLVHIMKKEKKNKHENKPRVSLRFILCYSMSAPAYTLAPLERAGVGPPPVAR
jgi:hypothetical protein